MHVLFNLSFELDETGGGLVASIGVQLTVFCNDKMCSCLNALCPLIKLFN